MEGSDQDRNDQRMRARGDAPVKDLVGARVTERHVRERAKDNGGDWNAVDGQATSGAPAEERRGLALEREGVEDTGRGVDVRVAGRPDSNQEDGVDDGREALDAGVVDSDDEWRLRDGRDVRVEQALVRVGDQDTDDENREDVEDENPAAKVSEGEIQ
jgi:hypothetical protein